MCDSEISPVTRFIRTIEFDEPEFVEVTDSQRAEMIVAAYERVDLPGPSVVFATGIDDFVERLKQPGNEEIQPHGLHFSGVHDDLFTVVVTRAAAANHFEHDLHGYLRERDLRPDLVGFYCPHRYAGLVRGNGHTKFAREDVIVGLAQIEMSCFAVYFGWHTAIVLPKPVAEYREAGIVQCDEDVLPRYQWADGSAVWVTPTWSADIPRYDERLARKLFTFEDLEGRNADDKRVICRRLGLQAAVEHFGGQPSGFNDEGSEIIDLDVYGDTITIYRNTVLGEPYYYQRSDRKNDMFGPEFRGNFIRKRTARREREKIVAAGAQRLLPSPAKLIGHGDLRADLATS